tara:strand:- start:2511 stop:2738 length:228 start_codon:yes stop_codon:yes gene_type:complete
MTEATQEAPTLTLQDLTLTANIIDLSVQRGAFKGAEAEQVGQMFNRLVAIIKNSSPVVDEEAAPAAPAAETEGKG